MEDWLKQVKEDWNKTSDSEWYKSLRTDEKIDELFSIENYKKILENKEVPKRIKECIELYLECNKVCKELETIIIKKD